MVSPAPSSPDPGGGAEAVCPRVRPAPPTPHMALALLGINALWGGSPVAAKAALAFLPPVSLTFARFALSAVLLYALAGALRVDLRVARRDWLPFWGMGAVGVALTYLFVYVGLQHTTAADTALIHAAEPVFLAVLSVLLLRERLGWGKAAGVALGLAGVLLIVMRGARAPGGGAVLGDVLVALGLVFESLAVIAGKRLVARYPPLTVLTYQMLTGAILLAPCAFAEGLHVGWRVGHAALGWPLFWSLAYLVLPCTVLGYAVWFLLLERHEASDMSMFLFLQPVSGALLGVWLQHDPLTPATLAGAALVLLGILLLHRRPAKTRLELGALSPD